MSSFPRFSFDSWFYRNMGKLTRFIISYVLLLVLNVILSNSTGWKTNWDVCVLVKMSPSPPPATFPTRSFLGGDAHVQKILCTRENRNAKTVRSFLNSFLIQFFFSLFILLIKKKSNEGNFVPRPSPWKPRSRPLIFFPSTVISVWYDWTNWQGSKDQKISRYCQNATFCTGNRESHTPTLRLHYR